jgi:hypothetical protein
MKKLRFSWFFNLLLRYERKDVLFNFLPCPRTRGWSLLSTVVRSAPAEDEITSFPGYGVPPSKHYVYETP